MSRPIYSSSYFMQGFILRFCVTSNINIRAKIVLFGKKKYQSLIFPLTLWIPAKNSEDPNKGPHKAAFLSGSAPLAKTKYHLEVHARELLYN